MGVTIQSPTSEIDMGYFSFSRLKQDIAYIADTALGQTYEKGLKIHTPEDAENYVSEIAEQMQDYVAEHGRNAGKIGDFIFADDCAGKITYGCCQELLKILKCEGRPEARERFCQKIYGYAGWGETVAKGKDFIRLLQECVAARKPLKWD